MITFKLRRLLGSMELSQKDLANMTGIRPPTISAICTNKIKELPVDVMDRICNALNCTPADWILFTKDE